MTLAQLIYKAIHDPQFRETLEAGGIHPDEWGLSDGEVTAAAQVMRSTRGLPTDGLWQMMAAYLRVDANAEPLSDTTPPATREQVSGMMSGISTPRVPLSGITGSQKGLARLIYAATQDAAVRQALIAGEVEASDWDVTPTELAAAVEVMRHGPQPGSGLGPLFEGY
jgi:hypothetical protein